MDNPPVRSIPPQTVSGLSPAFLLSPLPLGRSHPGERSQDCWERCQGERGRGSDTACTPGGGERGGVGDGHRRRGGEAHLSALARVPAIQRGGTDCSWRGREGEEKERRERDRRRAPPPTPHSRGLVKATSLWDHPLASPDRDLDLDSFGLFWSKF